MKKLVTLSCFALVLSVASCKKDEDRKEAYYTPDQYAVLARYLDLPETPPSYNFNVPGYLLNLGFANANLNTDRVTLGRVLFYDKNLSADRSTSCASCHRQELAFSDDQALSRGVMDRRTVRNSYPLGSVLSFLSGPYGHDRAGFFWDSRAGSVAEQCQQTFPNPNEMGLSLYEVVARVKEQPYYDPLFEKAFGYTIDYITPQEVLTALTDFVSSMNALNTRYEKELQRLNPYSISEVELAANQSFAGFTIQENNGKAIYRQHCMSCHGAMPSLPKFRSACNGLDAATTDPGIGGISNRSEEMGLFKVPGLCNVALTGPYMHDGRFATLDDVLEHYSSGIQSHPNLSPLLKDAAGTPVRMNFSDDEKAALLAFLHTLTDDKQRIDPRFADPFK
jgi:cytochrome c peroxidase